MNRTIREWRAQPQLGNPQKEGLWICMKNQKLPWIMVKVDDTNTGFTPLLSRSLSFRQGSASRRTYTELRKKKTAASTGKVTNIPLTMTEGAGTGWQWIPTASTGAVRKIWGKRKRRKKKKVCRLRQGQDFSSVNKMNVKTRSQMRFHIRISQIPLLVTVWPPACMQPSDFFFNLYIWNLIFYLWVR